MCIDLVNLIHCENSDLKKKDLNSDSDPFVVVYEKRTNRIDKKTGEKVVGFVELGRTETFKDNPNPIFETVFKFDYYFEETQTLRFECFDYDSAKKHELIGSCTMEVGEILHCGGKSFLFSIFFFIVSRVQAAPFAKDNKEHIFSFLIFYYFHIFILILILIL